MQLGSSTSVAQRIVQEGIRATLTRVPLLRTPGMTVVDRREIEGYRSIQSLLTEYCSKPQTKPISLAVFGPPGAGKSFGVMEIAQSIPGAKVEAKTFNLSQFVAPDELIGALHQVRDVALSDKTPLVFWDEFDTTLDGEPLGWLRYFLAPMNDGEFQDQQTTHRTGPGIFVFAGGTSATLEEFARQPRDPAFAAFRGAKGPDFLSRLRGYVNIMGPNPTDQRHPERDCLYALRRAVLLRGILERDAKHLVTPDGAEGKVQVDPGVLRALLYIPRYEHGVRSMRAIVQMSMLTGRTAFERSCLPSEPQLNVHVNGKEFMELVELPDLSDEQLEDTAAHLCDRYHRAKGDGLASGPDLRLWWAGLRDEEREANRAPVRKLPQLLALAGYTIMPRTGREQAPQLPEEDREKLFELEHMRWREDLQRKGWQWKRGRNKDAPRQRHPLLLPWRKLSPAQQAGNRSFVAELLTSVAEAGYVCVKLAAAPEGAPPRAPRELRVGAVGHRHVAELEQVGEGIARVLDQLGAAHPRRALAVLSPLVEGGPRLIAEEALARPGVALTAALPLEPAEMERDFADDESRRRFAVLLARAGEPVLLPPADNRDAAYAAADEYVVDESDVLLAVWDGEVGPRGSRTAQSVARALQQGMTVYQVQVGSRRPGTTEAASLGEEQGEVVIWEPHAAPSRQLVGRVARLRSLRPRGVASA